MSVSEIYLEDIENRAEAEHMVRLSAVLDNGPNKMGGDRLFLEVVKVDSGFSHTHFTTAGGKNDGSKLLDSKGMPAVSFTLDLDATIKALELLKQHAP